MVEVLYPDGYAPNKPYGRMATIDEVFARSSVKILHPEYQKRWRGLMIASVVDNVGKLGIGGGGRTTQQQEVIFFDRHNKVGSGGCCMYEGQRYQLKSGYAHASPPGLSFHEPIVQAGCAAVDAVGDLKWAALHCEAYGLAQASWGNELWHFQFHEFPNSVGAWKRSGSPAPQNWKMPGTGTKPPTTTPPPVTVTYTVQPGDSWYGIAAKLGCTPEALVAANPPATMSTVLHPGDVLKVPTSATKPPTTTPGRTPAEWVSYGTDAKTPPGNPQLGHGLVHVNVQELQAILCSMPTLPADGGKPIYDPAWVDKDKIGSSGKPTDNLFGDASEPALKYWQSKNGLKADAKFGPQTSAKMTQVRGK
jgi:LysM repeat protein